MKTFICRYFEDKNKNIIIVQDLGQSDIGKRILNKYYLSLAMCSSEGEEQEN